MNDLSCIDCAQGSCFKAEGDYPSFCPTAALNDQEKEALKTAYASGEDAALMNAATSAAARATAEMLCRAEETMEFAASLGAHKIGIAVCAGLINEGRIFGRILRANGFEPYGIACKAGALSRAEMGLQTSCCDYGSVSCNPILQAQLLNEEQTDLNVVIGLCVGHDSIFLRHSNAPCTVLVAKDRPLGHNPVAALRGAEGTWPYNRMMKPRLWGANRLDEGDPKSNATCDCR